MKQLLKFSLFLLAMLLPAVAAAHDFEVDGIYYNINGNEATVTYKGTSSSSKAYSGDVVIPETVTYNDTTYSVTAIGNYAFYQCSGLTSITIPNSVTTISKYAFNYCSGLTSVTIGNSVTTIETRAFAYCSGLTSLRIPNSVTAIGNYVFSSCTGLTSVSVASDNQIYDSRGNCNAIIETASNTLISGCQNTVIPNSVTTIGAGAYSYCTGLNSLTIPNSVTTIDNEAFWGCSGLTSITIPKSVSSIGSFVFSGCSGLTSVAVAGDNPAYDSRDNCNAIIETASNTLLNGCQNTVIPNSVTTIGVGAFYNCTGMTSVTIPNSVTSIDNNAFNRCSGLTSITIPNSVTTIGNNAFYYCSGLTTITIPNSVTSIGYNAFRECTDLKDVYSYIAYPDEISMGGMAFSLSSEDYSGRTLYVPYSCYWRYQNNSIWNYYFGNIVEMNTVEVDGIYYKYFNEGEVAVTYGDNKYTGDINIPETISYYGITCTVTAIDRDAFSECRGLTSVVIPNTVTTIDNRAFDHCTSLTSVTIGNAVASIGADAFYGCRGLTSIFIPSSVNSIGYCAFASCIGLTSIVVANDNPTFDSRNDCNAIIATANNSLIVGCQNTVIPNTVTDIGQRAFFECTNLKEIIIPNSVISFGYETFYYCTGLTSVTIGNSVTTIGMDAFEGCSGLTSIIIPNSVSTITYGAFRECTGLKNVYIPNSVTVIEGEAFTGCEALESVKIPNSVTTIGSSAFAYCTSLENVYSYITELSSVSMGSRVFYLKSQDYTNRTLHVPAGLLADYQGDAKWYPFFGNIVEIAAVAGDVDGDGRVSIADVTELIDLLLNGGEAPAADVDGDGHVTVADVTEIIDMLLGS